MDVIIPEDIGAFAAALWTWLVAFLPRFGAAVLILVAGVLIAKYASRAINTVAAKSDRVDATLRPIIAAIIRYGITIIVIVAALGQLGIQTASILAALGAAGLAIGLALQGTLANIASGLMLLWLRPFRIGEYIDSGTVAGTVKEIGLFATTLESFDGNYTFAPNAELWGKRIINYSRNPVRMTNIAVRIGYEADVGRARELLLDLLTSEARVLDEPAPDVVLDDLGDNGVTLAMRAWIANASYWATQRHLAEAATTILKNNDIDIAVPHRVLQIRGAETAAS